MKSQSEIFSYETAEESTGFLLWQVTSLWQREIAKTLLEFDLTHSQFVLLTSLYWLNLQNRDVTQIVLSNHTKIDPMTTSTVLRTLQKKGMLQRQEHLSDTRAKNVMLTELGESIIKKAVVAVEQFDKQFFSRLKMETTAFNQALLSLLK